MTIDPAVDFTLRGLLCLLLVVSSAHKLRDVPAFATTVDQYEILPGAWARTFAWILASFEAALGAALLLPAPRSVAGLAVAALIGVYSLAIGVNLARGRRDIDCGCLGPAHGQELSEWLLVRNGLVIVAALTLTLPASGRALNWVDGFSVTAAGATFALLFTAANQLLSQWPRMRALRRTP